jgi:hypothetical protein
MGFDPVDKSYRTLLASCPAFPWPFPKENKHSGMFLFPPPAWLTPLLIHNATQM